MTDPTEPEETSPEDKPLWNMEDLARYLGRSEGSVRKMRQLGLLPPGRQIGKRVYWKPEDIQKWNDEQGGDDGTAGVPAKP